MTSHQRIAATIIAMFTIAIASAFAQKSVKGRCPELGTELNGLTLGIGVDKNTYTVGEAIPVHVGFQNNNAAELS